jgi:hypothetical protein
MTDIVADISSIIPRMIFGVVLIVAWAPIILFTEFNNKGNREEYKLLLDKIKTDLKLTDITSQITYAPIPTGPNTYANFNYTPVLNDNKNVYINVTKTIRTIDSNGRESRTTVNDKEIIIAPLVNNIVISDANYKYLAMQNKIVDTTTDELVNGNITYNIKCYTIPKDKILMKVEGLQQFEKEIDMTFNDYEFGPEKEAIDAIKNNKSGSNTLQLWLGRIGTFLMLFGGLILLVAPLQTMVNMGESLPGPLKLLALPGRIILNIYNSLSFIGAFILTLLMTLFMWSLVNYPLISVLIGGLLIGLMMFFGKK